jgi:thymidylate synthase
MLPATYIDARDIPDAWFQCVYKILEDGFRYEVQHGSFSGQTRLEFDWVTVQIRYPYSEPYDTMVPEIPPQLGIPNPVSTGYIENYLPYLMTENKEPNEDYTYGSRIWPQVPHFIELLNKTPNTNQAVLQVAEVTDLKLHDPPCLRHIDMRIKEGTLIFYPYFRSWDLWGGFPANLAAIAVLQKYMADEIGVEIGQIMASSKGLHLYGYVEELAKIRCYNDIAG